MSRRDVRDAIVVQVDKDGFVSNGFTVIPVTNFSRVGRGHYVLVPVLNEQAGDDLVEELKRRADQPGAE